jgi:hypothetical protein
MINMLGDGGFFENSTANNFILKNNIAQDCDPGFATTFSSESTNNTSDDGTAPGENSQDLVVQFYDKDNHDYRLSPGDQPVVRSGVDLRGDSGHRFEHDIDGRPRPHNHWTRGAFEPVAAFSLNKVPLFLTVAAAVRRMFLVS